MLLLNRSQLTYTLQPAFDLKPRFNCRCIEKSPHTGREINFPRPMGFPTAFNILRPAQQIELWLQLSRFVKTHTSVLRIRWQ